MSFSSADNDAVSRNALTGGTGTQLYQASVIDPAKVEAVSVRWRNMVAGVRKALTNEKGTKAANAAAAKAAFDTGMGQLKVDMRAGEYIPRTEARGVRVVSPQPPTARLPRCSGQGASGRRRDAARDGDARRRRHGRFRLQHGAVQAAADRGDTRGDLPHHHRRLRQRSQELARRRARQDGQGGRAVRRVACRRAGIFLEDLALPFTVKIMNRLKNDYYVSTFFPFLPEAV